MNTTIRLESAVRQRFNRSFLLFMHAETIASSRTPGTLVIVIPKTTTERRCLPAALAPL